MLNVGPAFQVYIVVIEEYVFHIGISGSFIRTLFYLVLISMP